MVLAKEQRAQQRWLDDKDNDYGGDVDCNNGDDADEDYDDNDMIDPGKGAAEVDR